MVRKEMLPFPQPRWRYCHSTLNKLYSVLDELARLLQYICTHDQYIKSHFQQVWVQMRMLQLKEHSAVTLANTSLTQVQRPFKAYWQYRKYVQISMQSESMTHKASSLQVAYKHLLEQHEQLTTTFNKHNNLINAFVNRLHTSHQQKALLSQNQKSGTLLQQCISAKAHDQQKCSSEDKKKQKESSYDVSVNVDVLLLSCKDVQESISRVARALIALCEPNLLSSSSSFFTLQVGVNNLETQNNSSKNDNSKSLRDCRLCKRDVVIHNSSDKIANDSFYDSEHMYSNHTQSLDQSKGIHTATNLCTSAHAAINGLTHESQTNEKQPYKACIWKNKQRPMSNTDVHMTSFESNDSNITHDTVPHTLCKTHNTRNKQSTNINTKNNMNNTGNTNNSNDNLQMSSTLQTIYKQRDVCNSKNEYNLRRMQQVLQEGLHCIQVQLTQLTHTQHEMMHKMNILVNDVQINRNGDMKSQGSNNFTANTNSNEAQQRKTEAQYRAEIRTLQANLFAWQQSTKRLSHTLELTQTALHDEQLRSSRMEQQNKSLQERIEQLIVSKRRRYDSSPQQMKQLQMITTASSLSNKQRVDKQRVDKQLIKNIKNAQGNQQGNATQQQQAHPYNDQYVQYINNIQNNNSTNLQFTPTSQSTSKTIHGITPIAQIRAGIQRRLQEVAQLANSLQRVKLTDKQQQQQLQLVNQQQKQTQYDQQHHPITKRTQHKNFNNNFTNENKHQLNSASMKRNNLQRSQSKSVSEIDVSISPLSQDNSVMCDEPNMNNNNDNKDDDDSSNSDEREIDDDGCDVIDISECDQDDPNLTRRSNLKKGDKKQTLTSSLSYKAPQSVMRRNNEMNDAEKVLQNAKHLLARLHNRVE